MQVDLSEEEDQFQAVTTACLNVLMLAVETRLDVALQQMTRVPWATLETVRHPSHLFLWCHIHCRIACHVIRRRHHVPFDRTANAGTVD